MAFALLRRSQSCTDDTNACSNLNVRNNKQASTRGAANGNETVFADRMVGIAEGCGQRIIKNGYRLIERDTMFFEIALCLGAVPSR